MASKISEAWYLHPLTIDTAYQRAIEDMVASPEDAKGKGIDLTLKCNGEAVDTTGCTVILGWRNLNSGKSNSRLFDAVSAASGRWKVTYPTEMLTPGVVLARVIIKLSATGSVITSSREFRIIVEHAITNDIAGGSNDDLSMFQQAVADLTATNDAVAKAETKRVEAEQARAAAEQERLRAESARIDNESTRVDSETGRTTAESERAAAEKARVVNEEGRTRSESERSRAESERAAAEEDRVSEFAELKSQSQSATNAADGAARKANAAADNANAAAATASSVVAEAVKALSQQDSDSEAAQIDALAKLMRDDYGCFYLANTVWTKSAETSYANNTLTLSCASFANGNITLG